MNKKLLVAAGIATGLAATALVVAAGVITYRIIKDDDPYLYRHVYKGI